MVVGNKKVVTVTYELRKNENAGEIIETATESNPLVFVCGAGSMIPKFEKNLSGLKVGDSFDFELKSKEAYGEINPDALVDVPLSVFEVDGKIDSSMLEVGNSIPMLDNSGNRLNGKVNAVNDKSVRMDFNHPLAGDNLFFKGKVVEIREATDEEMDHGHIHASGGCGSGGCGCGSSDEEESGSCCSSEKESSGCGCGCV